VRREVRSRAAACRAATALLPRAERSTVAETRRFTGDRRNHRACRYRGLGARCSSADAAAQGLVLGVWRDKAQRARESERSGASSLDPSPVLITSLTKTISTYGVNQRSYDTCAHAVLGPGGRARSATPPKRSGRRRYASMPYQWSGPHASHSHAFSPGFAFPTARWHRVGGPENSTRCQNMTGATCANCYEGTLSASSCIS
jgi:hypothetical protein